MVFFGKTYHPFYPCHFERPIAVHDRYARLLVKVFNDRSEHMTTRLYTFPNAATEITMFGVFFRLDISWLLKADPQNMSDRVEALEFAPKPPHNGPDFSWESLCFHMWSPSCFTWSSLKLCGNWWRQTGSVSTVCFCYHIFTGNFARSVNNFVHKHLHWTNKNNWTPLHGDCIKLNAAYVKKLTR